MDGGYWSVQGDSVFIVPEYSSNGLMNLATEFIFRARHRIQFRKPYGERQFRIVDVGEARLRIQPPTPIGMEKRRIQTYFADVDRAAEELIPKSEQSPGSKIFEIPDTDNVFGP